MMCYEKSCRLCLKELNGPGIDCSNINELRDTISKLFEVQINRNDNIKCICNKCFEHVMSFRAFKKTVTECQKIIKEYQTIKKKVLETRLISSIKQEVIDVDEASENATPDRNKRKRTGAVTDSDINDILALVHDKSPANSRALKVSSTSIPKKVKIVPIAPITIKIEPQTHTPQQTTTNRGRSTEPISSTSRDLLDKTVQSDDKLSSYSIGSSLDASSKAKNQPLKKASAGQSTSSASPASVDTNAEAVSSSVQTPSESRNKTNNLQQAESSTSKKQQPPATPAVLTANTVSITNSFTEPSNQTDEMMLTCSKCSTKFKNKSDLETHMTNKHRIVKAVIEKQEPPKVKEIKKMKEEEPISSSEEDKISIRGRSTRRAKSKAIKILAASPTGLSTSPSLRRSTRAVKPTDTPNNSLTEPRHTSTPILAAATTLAFNVTTVNNNSKTKSTPESAKSDTNRPITNNTTPAKNTSLNKSGEKKRIITITLVRTKESLNFRYCDQYKRSIDFGSVSSDELEDIRKSLMIPEIWTNLKNVFKVSPPDDKTIDELRTIFGQQFNI